MKPSREIVMVAAGPVGYLEMCVDLALILREHNSEDRVLVLDAKLESALRPEYAALFARVVPLPEIYGARNLGKLAVAEAVEADEALFLDADVMVPRSLGSLWKECAGHDFVLQGEHLTVDKPAQHHLLNTSRLIKRFGLPTYLKSNSGWFYFKRDCGREVLAEAFALSFDRFFHRHAWVYGFVPDEPLLGIVGGRRGLTTRWYPLVMPWNLEGVEPDDPRYQVLHLIGPPSDALATWWREGVERRRRVADVPGVETCWQPWAAKIAKLNKIRRRKQRFGWLLRWLERRA